MFKHVVLMLSVVLCVQAYAAAPSAQYPVRPIRIVTGDIAGAPDIVVRLMTPALTEVLGEQVIVDNRGGANGGIAAQTVARSQADGYNLLFYASALWLSPVILGSNEDPLKGLTPLSFVAGAPNVLVVHPSVPAKSVKELIALAKAKPGTLNYGSGGVGSSPYLAGELFKYMAGVNVVRVGYKGGGPAVNDLLGGHLQFMFSSATAAAPHVASGRLRALGVSSTQPSALAPGLPTIASSGLPGFETQGVYALFVPTGTPRPVTNLLLQKTREVLARPATKERFLQAGVEPVGSSPEELATLLKAELVRWAKLAREAGLKGD